MAAVRGDHSLTRIRELTASSVVSRRGGRFAEAVSAVAESHAVVQRLDERQLSEFLSGAAELRAEWATTLALAGEDLRALRAWERAWEAARDAGDQPRAASAAASAAGIHAFRGDHHYAEVWLRRADAAAPTSHALAAATRALICLDTVDLAEAERHLEDAKPLEGTESWAVLLYLRARFAVLTDPSESSLLRMRASCLAHHPRLWSSGLNWALVFLATEMLGEALGVPAPLPPLDGPEGAVGREALLLSRLREAAVAAQEDHIRDLVVEVLGDPAISLRTVALAQLLFALARPADPKAKAAALAALETVQAERLHGILLTLPLAPLREVLVDRARKDPRLAEILPGIVADPAPEPLPALTPRERVVWGYLAGDLTLKQIAATEFLSLNTIKSHVKSLYRKLGVNDRAAAAALARLHVPALRESGASTEHGAIDRGGAG